MKNLLAACFIVRVGLFIRHLLHPWWIIMEKQSDSNAVFYNAQCTRLLVTLMWVQCLHPYQSRAGIMKVSLENRLARTQAFLLFFDLCSTWLNSTGWLVLWPYITPKTKLGLPKCTWLINLINVSLSDSWLDSLCVKLCLWLVILYFFYFVFYPLCWDYTCVIVLHLGLRGLYAKFNLLIKQWSCALCLCLVTPVALRKTCLCVCASPHYWHLFYIVSRGMLAFTGLVNVSVFIHNNSENDFYGKL